MSHQGLRSRVMRPVDAVTLTEAARILGVARSTVQLWVIAGRLRSYGGRGQHRMLSQADLEELARFTYPWHRRVSNDQNLWMAFGGVTWWGAPSRG